MGRLESGIRWVMLLSGVLTCTMLIYGAFAAPVRRFVLVVAVLLDALWVVIFAAYLLATAPAAARPSHTVREG